MSSLIVSSSSLSSSSASPASLPRPALSAGATSQKLRFVLGRDGQPQPVQFGKIQDKLWHVASRLSAGDQAVIDPNALCMYLVSRMHDMIPVSELDELAIGICEGERLAHPCYGRYAAAIAIDNMHKSSPPTFSESVRLIAACYPAQIAPGWQRFVAKWATELDALVDDSRDAMFSVFGLETLTSEGRYVTREMQGQKKSGRLIDRPQYMFMRVALCVTVADPDTWTFEQAKSAGLATTYDLLSRGKYIHGSPTLFNACGVAPQLLSCFLMTVPDALEDIMDALKQGSQISKWAGGLGIDYSRVRATGAWIRGVAGPSSGIMPQLSLWNGAALTWNQGSKRKGSFAIFLEPWHGDVFDWLRMRMPNPTSPFRTQDLFHGLWVNDLFMKRLIAAAGDKAKKNWTLFSPDTAPGLTETFGDEFEQLYARYEADPAVPKRAVSPVELLELITKSLVETGTPYICFKDHANRKSNQANYGIIRSSNLCVEIMEASRADSTACCTLASIGLAAHLRQVPAHSGLEFDHDSLFKTAQQVLRNLDRVIDVNSYPTPQAAKNNKEMRPVGIGVQGLADVFAALRMPFDGPEARVLNREIAETIYFGALTASCELAQEVGPYAYFEGSPLSKGKFQFDLHNDDAEGFCAANAIPHRPAVLSGRWDWEGLRAACMKHGVRNSLVCAWMPTATTAQILGNNECFEPFTRAIYKRQTLCGTHLIINTMLQDHLIELGLWTKELGQEIAASGGSLSKFVASGQIPEAVAALYKTAYEIKASTLLDMAADRAPFIDQSQSLNLYVPALTPSMVAQIMYKGWSLGLKTGSYYIHTQREQSSAIKVSRPVPAPALADSPASATTASTPVPLAAPVQAEPEPEAAACPRGCESCSG